MKFFLFRITYLSLCLPLKFDMLEIAFWTILDCFTKIEVRPAKV